MAACAGMPMSAPAWPTVAGRSRNSGTDDRGNYAGLRVTDGSDEDQGGEVSQSH